MLSFIFHAILGIGVFFIIKTLIEAIDFIKNDKEYQKLIKRD